MAEKPIVYESHPVAPERKTELVNAGFRIIDAIYAPREEVRDPLDHDSNGKKGGSPKPEPSAELVELRAAYLAKVGKKPFGGWDAETLKAKIAEAAGS